MAAKRLTFPNSLLAPVLTGAKHASIRFTKAAAAARPGEALVLQFGAYHRPTCLEATVRRVALVDLEADLARAYTLPEHVRSLVEERRFYERPLEPDANTAPDLCAALRDSGTDLEAVVGEAAERGVTSCTCVWWQLT